MRQGLSGKEFARKLRVNCGGMKAKLGKEDASLHENEDRSCNQGVQLMRVCNPFLWRVEGKNDSFAGRFTLHRTTVCCASRCRTWHSKKAAQKGGLFNR
jgi:hypothetical protein